MSETQQQQPDDAEQDDNEGRDFFDALRMEGATMDGSFYCTTGTGRATRYHEYDPGLVKGFDAVREDGGIVAQEVANHDEALVDDVSKGDLEDAAEKYEDGFGVSGLAVVESEADEGGDGSGGGEPDYEPMEDDEVLETIRRNHDEHGFFAENDDGEQKVVSLAHPDARLMGYITGSHVGALPAENLSTVDDYRAAVYQALGGDLSDAEPIAELGRPDDVPIATDDMMDKFREAGGGLDDEAKEKIGRQVKRRWEDGQYDHLRKDDDEEADADDE